MKDLKKMEIAVLDMEEVKEKTGVESEFLLDMLRFGGVFPQPVVACGQNIGWSEKEICEWMWIKAIEASWRGEGPWKGEEYSSLRHPSNLFGSNSEILEEIRAELRVLSAK
ncbi:MAG: AlpA family phage regulatory protein [Pseudomonadota bacterium]